MLEFINVTSAGSVACSSDGPFVSSARFGPAWDGSNSYSSWSSGMEMGRSMDFDAVIDALLSQRGNCPPDPPTDRYCEISPDKHLARMIGVDRCHRRCGGEADQSKTSCNNPRWYD